MWTFDEAKAVDQNEMTDIEDHTALSMVTIKNDTLLIKNRLVKQLSKENRRKKHLVNSREVVPASTHEKIARLKSRLTKVETYLERLERPLEIEMLLTKCKRINIDPSQCIVTGGGTLKAAAQTLYAFKKEPILFQTFDREYEKTDNI